jgi:twitching motility protein PilT
MNLQSLVFSDLFLAQRVQDSWYKATPDAMNVQAVPADCHAELAELRTSLQQHNGKSGFRIAFTSGDAEPLGLRIERIAVANGETIYVCRRHRLPPGALISLGMPPNIADQMMSPSLHNGLVVFFGKAGSGKTTSAASFAVERLSRFGGVCWTVENPIEMNLQGAHGRGWCYQTEVDTDNEIGPAIRRLMRATPNLIFIGELRDGVAVAEAITAAASGHLVVTTFHASDLVAGLARLTRLAKIGNGERDAAAALADVLRIGAHLHLNNYRPGEKLPGSAPEPKGTGTPPRVLTVEPIALTGAGDEGVRSILRDGDFHRLRSEIERQRRTLMMGNKLP